MLRVLVLALALAGPGIRAAAIRSASSDKPPFTPSHRLVAVGAGRQDLDDEQLLKRTDLMIEAQQFAILRDPHSLAGAQKILSPRMLTLFREAERQTGVRWSLIAAIAYLESWGESDAQSPAGPRGVMQIASGTARSMGLRTIYATRYRTVTAKQTVKTKRGKTVTKSVRKKVPYSVLVRDERLVPERAIPAAAAYLARLEKRYEGQDWAVFAYHCGEGCVASMRELTRQAKGMKPPYTVPKMFFGGDPSHNRELYQAVMREMERDYSPTYYFRVMCSERLLGLYRKDPSEFKRLMEENGYEPNPKQRAPHRLSAWLRTKDLEYQTCDDIRSHVGKGLARVFDDEDFYGFRVRKDLMGAGDAGDVECYLQASPSTIGTLAYIAYETRRLHTAMHPKGEQFAALEVTALAEPGEFTRRSAPGRDEILWHSTGQVFDIDIRNLPVGEREALDFILDDIGNMGYLGFVEESPRAGVMHIGSSPSSRDFFSEVFEDALAASKK